MSGSRRQFLFHAAAAAAAINRMTANPLDKPIGLQLYTLSAELEKDFDGTLARISQIGIKEVEIAANYNKPPAGWRAALSKHGLHCRSVHMFDSSQSPEQVMSFASQVGAKYVVSSLNPPPAIAKLAGPNPDWTHLVHAVETMTFDDWKKSADVANELGKQAAKHGLLYAYHNHNVEFKKFGDTTAFDMLLVSTNPAKVHFEMDCGWVGVSGHSPVSYLQKYPERIRLLHIKAFQAAPPNLNLVGPKAPKPTELGRGKPDYGPIFAAAAKAKVEQYYMEQEPPFVEMTALQAVKMNYDYLHSL
jgi:sugar phosphate isomerase/epimerase